MNKDKQLLIRVTEDEKSDFEEAAAISGVGFSAWARQVLRTATISEFKKVDRAPRFLANQNNK